MNSNPIKIQIISDIVCPWCVIGYYRLSRILARKFSGKEIDIEWLPYQLHPDMPAQGLNLKNFMKIEYGMSDLEIKMLEARLIETGVRYGVGFNFNDEKKIFNSFKAHQLLYWARLEGKQTKLQESLWRAYFVEDLNISDDLVLLDCAESCGLDAKEAVQILTEGRFALMVRQAEVNSRRKGLNGLPAFVLNEDKIIYGAQRVRSFARIVTDHYLQDDADQAAKR